MTRDDYRYELPDFILGKSSPDVASAMERLIETDPEFRVEFLEMKSLIESATPMLNRAFDAPSPEYFETLSKKVMARAMPKRATWRSVLKGDMSLIWTSLRLWLIDAPRWQWAGGLAGATLALALVILASALDDETRQTRLAKRASPSDLQPASLVATSHFALGTTPELVIAQIEESEAEEALKDLERKLPTRKQTYDVLTEDEAESLFNPM